MFFSAQYGRNALEIVMKSIVKLDTPLVSPPSDFKGDFFKGVTLNLHQTHAGIYFLSSLFPSHSCDSCPFLCSSEY